MAFFTGPEDLFSDEEYRMAGEALQFAEPLPPGLDWDYFNDPRNELGDTENPAVDAVFDWGQPLIGAEGSGLGARGSGEDVADYEICERMVPPGSEAVVSGGERFRHLVRQLRARGVRNPEGLAAYIGRRKYGDRRFAAMAAAGRRGR